MDYELRIVVEKVAVHSQEVIKRDTITSYALQRPTSIGDLGLRASIMVSATPFCVCATQKHLTVESTRRATT